MELKMYTIRTKVFQLELHAGRTLAEKGVKKADSVAQSTSAITNLLNSYTIQPIISVGGKLLSSLFIVLKEPSGTVLSYIISPSKIN